jgi:hypothetical protein
LLVVPDDLPEAGPGLGDLEPVLLERAGLVPDCALRVGLRDDAVGRVLEGREIDPYVAVVLVDLVHVETEILERDQRVVAGELVNEAGPRQDSDLRGVPGVEPRPDHRQEVAGSFVLGLDPGVLGELREDPLERLLLAPTPEREDRDLPVAFFRPASVVAAAGAQREDKGGERCDWQQPRTSHRVAPSS